MILHVCYDFLVDFPVSSYAIHAVLMFTSFMLSCLLVSLNVVTC